MHLLDESRIEVGRAAERDVVFVTVSGQWIYFNILPYILQIKWSDHSRPSRIFFFFPKTALPLLDDDIGYSLMNQEKIIHHAGPLFPLISYSQFIIA